jgi:hypothetical protein
MTHLTFSVPENKIIFIKELMLNLGIEEENILDIPKEHKAIVLNRIQNSRPEDWVPWEEARQKLKVKYPVNEMVCFA